MIEVDNSNILTQFALLSYIILLQQRLASISFYDKTVRLCFEKSDLKPSNLIAHKLASCSDIVVGLH
jgi:hypothetical protein